MLGYLGHDTGRKGPAVTENVAEQALAAERLRTALDMRARGAHWHEIATACRYSSPAAALRAVGVAMAEATQRAEETADMMRDTAQLRLERLLSDAMSMIAPVESERYDSEGNSMGPEDDRAVRLRAVDESRRLVESITKLQKLDKLKEDPKDDKGGIRIIGLAVDDIA